MTMIVYLDTQDYINLFYESNGGPNHDILDQIISYRNRGDISIGFSFVTIIEFITKSNVANREERVRRGQLIKNICGPNAFPYLTDLAAGATFPNGGKWILRGNDLTISAAYLRKRIHRALTKKLAETEGLNRSQRRRLARKATMHELFRRTGSAWGRTRADWGDFPISDELLESRIIERFMKGECSDGEFETQIYAWLSDPAEYSRIIYDYSDQPNVLDKYFGKSLEDMEKIVNDIQLIASEFKELDRITLEMRKTLIESGIEKERAKRITKTVGLPSVEISLLEEKLEPVVGLGRAGHIGHFIKYIMKQNHSFKRSDIMDLLQMCYAYDCDFFRCDKSMANIFKDYEPFSGKLISRFKDLPEKIADRVDG